MKNERLFKGYLLKKFQPWNKMVFRYLKIDSEFSLKLQIECFALTRLMRIESYHENTIFFFSASTRLSVKVGSKPVVKQFGVARGSKPVVQALGGRDEAGPVGVLNKWLMGGGSACARRYVRDCRHIRVLLKIDMRSAFNSLKRDSFLSVARVRTPGL